jgi:hypothetical protein
MGMIAGSGICPRRSAGWMQAGHDRALTSAGNCGPGSGREGNEARERGRGRLAELSLTCLNHEEPGDQRSLGPARARSVLGLRRARALVLDRLAHRRLKVVSRAWRCPSRPRWTRSRHRCCSSGRLYRDAQSPPPYWHGSRRKVVAVSKLSTAAARAEAEASRRSRRRGPRRGPSGLARAGWPGGCPARRRRRE